MATEPAPDPIEEEIREVLEANPGLRERLRHERRLIDARQVRGTSHSEVVRRLGLELEAEPDEKP
jgi:hypothetical protein